MIDVEKPPSIIFEERYYIPENIDLWRFFVIQHSLKDLKLIDINPITNSCCIEYLSSYKTMDWALGYVALLSLVGLSVSLVFFFLSLLEIRFCLLFYLSLFSLSQEKGLKEISWILWRKYNSLLTY